MRRPVIAGNWKMHKTIRDSVEYIRALKPLISSNTYAEVVVAPPFTAMRAASDAAEGSNIAIAGQDVASESGHGAFTGEISATMLLDAGAVYAIIGHSERREYYGETNSSVNRKLFCSFSAGLIPIVCVGETLDQRDGGQAEKVVKSQVTEGLANLTPDHAKRMILAYEPVWAIGTGRTATPELAEEMHSLLRSRINNIFGSEVAEAIRILYGGSVKPDNIAALMEQPDIDGALVGGASLEADSFGKIVNFRNGG